MIGGEKTDIKTSLVATPLNKQLLFIQGYKMSIVFDSTFTCTKTYPLEQAVKINKTFKSFQSNFECRARYKKD